MRQCCSMPSRIVEDCVATLVRRNLKIAFADSATAGRFASEIAAVKNSGFILLGGIVCYDVSVKRTLLNIPEDMIKKFTPESPEVTKALAENLREHFDADVIVAVTGLASPGGSETDEKPVGTMFLHILFPQGFVAHRELFEGNQEEIILQAVDRGCRLITKKMEL